ncbi:MAG: hypothetical protein KUG75_13105 [Pseudomonadales bacterium]|nr:hypothetical protein [Pseudomonadales bacterium]
MAETNATSVCSIEKSAYAARPENADMPTVVQAGISVLDILSIDDIEQNTEMDILVNLAWRDSRLAAYSGCRAGIGEIWTPDLQMVNAGDMRSNHDLSFQVGEGGWIEGSIRFQGKITTPRHMVEFPFDTSPITLSLTSARYSSEELELRVAEEWTFIAKETSIPDWRIGEMNVKSEVAKFAQLSQDRSVLWLEIAASRQPDYYIYKVIIPLIMIMMMSWGVFWIDPGTLGAQISLSGTSMLTLIAFQFSMNEILPRVGYFTVLDRFILLSSILVFAALVEAIAAGYLASQNRVILAAKIDRISRWAFPTTYLLIVLVTLVFRINLVTFSAP